MSEDPPEPDHDAGRVGLPLLVAALVLLPTLGLGSLLSSDDALYAQMAREMVESGSWLEPRWLGSVIFDKPPLLFWLLGSLGALFGFGESVLRLPGVIGSLVALAYGLRIAGLTLDASNQDEGLRRDRSWALLFLILGTVTFVMNVRRPMADPLLMAAILAHLYYGLLAVDRTPGAATGAGIALGLGLLAKWVAVGPVALVVGVGWIMRRRLGALLTSSAVALSIAAPWHLWMHARHGADFWNTYLGYHVFGRVSGAIVGQDDPLYYVRVLAEQDGLIACVLALGLLLASLRVLVRSRPLERPLLALSWVVAAAIMTLLTLHGMSTRLFHYMLPVVPLAAIATVASVDRLPRPKLAHRILMGVGVLGFLMGPLYPHLLAPDYGARSKTLAERHLSSLPPSARVLLWEDYDPALLWYAHRRVTIYTADERFYSLQMSVDMMRRSGAVVWADEAARDALVQSPESLAFVAPVERSHLLESWSKHASLSRPVRLVRDPELGRLIALWGALP